MPLSAATQQAIAAYDESDTDELSSKLAIYAATNQNQPEKLDSAMPAITSEMQTMGLMEDIQELGGRLLKRWATELHRIVCGAEAADADDRKTILSAVNAQNFTTVGVATAITTVLVTSFALSAAIAPLLAVLIAKIIIEPGKDVMCQFWGEKLKTL